MSAPLLSVRSVTAFYGRVQALKGIDLDVQPGSVHALMGPNGSGKSTLAFSVAGADTASALEALRARR